jgi:Mn2+/Fe2+ NRAMP family transporter
VWALVLRGTYRQVEIIFLVACGFYLSYVISAIMAKPDWLLAAQRRGHSQFAFSIGLFVDADGAGGTTIAPWQFFYLQAGFVEKKVSVRGSTGRRAPTCWSAASVAW